MRKLITILGSPLDTLSMSEAIDRMVDFVATGRATQKYHQVATVNVDFLVKALSDPELRGILQEIDMATIDGMPLVWGGRWLGADVPQRVAGSDFVPLLAKRAAQEGLSIYLLGATPKVSATATKKLQEQNPELVIAGVNSPPFRPVLEMDPGIADEIKAADPDILLVAFGNPKQEKWIEIYGPQLNVPLMVGIGATLDFIAGEMKRAPKWLQRLGLEWLFRMLQEPRRLFKRYFKDIIIFSTYFSRQWHIQHPRKDEPSQPSNISFHTQGQDPSITVQGALDINDYPAIWEIGQQALELSDNLYLNFKECTFIDSSVIGAFMGIAKQARDQGGNVWLTSVSPQIQKIFSFHQVDGLFLLASPSRSNPLPSEEQADTISNPQGLKTHIMIEDGIKWLVVKAPNRLDGKSSPDFEHTCSSYLEPHTHVVIDLSDTLFISSGGLIVLGKLTHLAAIRQGKLIISNASPDTHRVIQIHNFEQKLNLCPKFLSALE